MDKMTKKEFFYSVLLCASKEATDLFCVLALQVQVITTNCLANQLLSGLIYPEKHLNISAK